MTSNSSDPDPTDLTQRGGADEATTSHVRGSSVLLVGRVASLGLNLAVQVLVVRYLSTSDFGVFSYAVAFAAFIQVVVTLGQERNISRALSTYEEQGRYRNLFGSIALYINTVVVMTGLAVLCTAALAPRLTESLDNQYAGAVLVIMTLMAPMDALDTMGESFFAVFARPRAIFFRKYVLRPLLKLAVALLVIIAGQSVVVLAVGQVIAGAIGLALYAVQAPTILRARGLLEHFSWRSISMPVREITRYSLPMLSTQLVSISMITGSVVLLGYFEDADAVAAYRSVFPLARMNGLVLWSFAILFLPLAARQFARRADEEFRHSYWQTAAWVTVFSFPVAAATISLAAPTTVLLFGERYASSAASLAVLSIGYCANVLIGFNVESLQVIGRVRWIIGVSVVCALLNLGLSAALIPPLGAFGVALANALTLLVQNAANQVGLARHSNIGYFDRTYAPVYLSVIGSLALLAALQLFLGIGVFVGVPLAVALMVLIARTNRRALQLGRTFPELARIPLVGRLLS